MHLLLRISVCIVCLFAVTCPGIAQSKVEAAKKARPDLSGVWVHVSTKSDPEDRGKITDYVLTIIHKEPEIKMIVQFKRGGRDHLFQTIYYTDGRPELNSGFSDPQPFTGWRGKKLVRVTTSGPPGSIGTGQEARVTVEWEPSDDGVTLTRTTSIAGVFGGKVTSIFNRRT